GEQGTVVPPDPLETIERDGTRRGHVRCRSCAQIDSHETVAVRDVGDALVAAGGETREWRRRQADDPVERGRTWTEFEELTAGRIEHEHRASRRDREIDQRDRLQVLG